MESKWLPSQQSRVALLFFGACVAWLFLSVLTAERHSHERPEFLKQAMVLRHVHGEICEAARSDAQGLMINSRERVYERLGDQFFESGYEPAAQVVQVDVGQAWEQIGDFVLTCERRAVGSSNARCVIGFALLSGYGRQRAWPGMAVFLMSDGSTRAVLVGGGDAEPARYRMMVQDDRVVRAELGLSDPPDYAAIIREYVDAQKDG